MKYSYLMSIKYQGTNFTGWVKQNSKTSIQDKIERAIARVSKTNNFKTLGASKTDAGVHALDQKMKLDLNFQPNISGFLMSVNRNLQPDIFISKMELINKEFKVRNCKEKIYQYNINFGQYDFFNHNYEWWIKEGNKFNFRLFKKTILLFKGLHDFYNFSGISKKDKEWVKTLRDIRKINVKKKNKKVKVLIYGKSFIKYQIRMIIGFSVACAIGKKDYNELENIFKGEIKNNFVAKPEGLILKKIVY